MSHTIVAKERLDMIRGLVKTLPGGALDSLNMALGLSRDEAMTEVRGLIMREIEYRGLRDIIFDPFLPLFETRSDGIAGRTFPSWVLRKLWDRLTDSEPALCEASGRAMHQRSGDAAPDVFYVLVEAAAQLCIDLPELIAGSEASADDIATVAEFGRYLALYRIVRNAVNRLYEFMGRLDADRAVSLRVMFKDASDKDPSSGYRFLETLFAHLDDGAQIIKFMVTVSDRASDRFLVQSELADFGERVIRHIETKLSALKQAMGNRHRDCEDLVSAADTLIACLGHVQTLETYVEMTRDGPWGKRVSEARGLISGLAEGQFKKVEKAVGAVLPLKSERVYGMVKREVADFDAAPAEAAIAKARDNLVFVRTVRTIASNAGFASAQARTAEIAEAQLDGYFAQLLSEANSTEPYDQIKMLAYMNMTTDLMEALCGEEKAATARRRIAASDVMNPKTPVQGAA